MEHIKLAVEMLSRDPLYGKIPRGCAEKYVSRAVALGEKAAEEYMGRLPSQLYLDMGIALKVSTTEWESPSVRLRAELVLEKEGAVVILYPRAINRLQEILEENGDLPGLGGRRALELVCAHELFHYLELKGIPVNEQLPPVVLWSLPGYTRKGTLRSASEISAHRFAQMLLGMCHFPYWYDKQEKIKA